MHWIDWTIMLGTLLLIVGYGVRQTRKINSTESYLKGDKDLKWWTIGLSVMATQASAITFLSTPGQAYESGMGFAQFYFGMPVAMVLLCIFVLPIYYRLNVFTAYQYLEGRFDVRVRTLTAVLFLIQRGLAAGITIYAPAIILSNIFEWNLNATILLIGGLVIAYTVTGGTKAVSVTQKQQMIVILIGMFLAAVFLVFQLPENVSFGDAVGLAGNLNKLEVVNFELDLENRYTFWTGMLGGVFLFLSYFGTDQSQVQRYLSGKSLTESRLGLLFNGIVKVPMQFLILFVGVLVFVFYQFTAPPLHFNDANVATIVTTPFAGEFQQLETTHATLFSANRTAVESLIEAERTGDAALVDRARAEVLDLRSQMRENRTAADELLARAGIEATKDEDYVFISFITHFLPIGLVGLLLAVIFSAAMSSSSSELNALATTSIIDLYQRSLNPDRSDEHYLNASKVMTVLWGVVALLFAMVANLFDNLIEAVNIVGSVFYGTILGIFVVAFFLKSVGGRAVFVAALLAELIVLLLFTAERMNWIELPYLWLNLIGCLLVMLFATVLRPLDKRPLRSDERSVFR